MKGPSLDAIRKFKQQLEQKKRDDETKRVEDKLNTLQHRAAHGDRKAKVLLTKLEEDSKRAKSTTNTEKAPRKASAPAPAKKPNSGLTDFDELMRLAQSNNNEIRKKEKPKQIHIPKIRKTNQVDDSTARVPPPQPSQPPRPTRPPQQCPVPPPRLPQQPPRPMPSTSRTFRPPPRRYDEEDYEDEYEDDGFVVDEDDDEVRAELNKTLKDVFRYDKRRADRLEQEVDRHYRAIGRVSTFDDLEREERRASRLAQAEDAKEQRLEEERKRLKKQKLKGFR